MIPKDKYVFAELNLSESVHSCRMFLFWWNDVFWQENIPLESFWPAQIASEYTYCEAKT